VQQKHEKLRDLKKAINICQNSDDGTAARLYRQLRKSDEDLSQKVRHELDSSMMSDLSACSFNTHERFYKKWEPIITSGEDFSTHLNSHASWLLPRKDCNLSEV
jgi:bacterioferritin (cytochrome b1)